MTIEKFVDNSEDFDMYEYKLKWNDYNVYEVWLKSCEYSCTDYPNMHSKRTAKYGCQNWKRQ